MDFLQGFIVITGVHLLAAASPGPDFVLVTQQALSNGKKAALYCSLGIALGLSIHIVYSALGLAVVIANSSAMLFGIKLLGGSYLTYLGIKGLLSKKAISTKNTTLKTTINSPSKSIGLGFLCNMLNPKAPLYFVALFTVVISPSTPPHHLALYGVWMMFLQFMWFAFLSHALSTPYISKIFHRFSHCLDRVLGGAMIFLGLKVLLTRTANG